MDTPIFDFVKKYIENDTKRLHMPGHKGKGEIGAEPFDITEIKGADSLYEANGIIEQSEKNASLVFGTKKTFYSAEGSSLCIRAMLYLTMLFAKEKGLSPVVFAGRNAHKTFLSAAALLDFEVKWLYSSAEQNYLSCVITPEILEKELSAVTEKPCAVYVTSPDYLGFVCDIRGLSEVCRKYGVLLLVDNAHGAYLKFLNRHPMDLGADMCSDSAHKTLPVLTGGAYLHIGKYAPEILCAHAKNSMSLFGSTSPSYLILQSLDLANKYLSDGYRQKLEIFSEKLSDFKKRLTAKSGYVFCGNEPLKITVDAKKYGYYGEEIAEILRKSNIECEFSDPDFAVFMITPEQEAELEILEKSLASIGKREEIIEKSPVLTEKERILSIREAMLSPFDETDINEAEGKISACASVGCPPAVPILVSGEKIDKNAVDAFRYYGIKSCCTVKK